MSPNMSSTGKSPAERVARHVPSDYVRIRSALGEARPLNIVVVPVIYWLIHREA